MNNGPELTKWQKRWEKLDIWFEPIDELKISHYMFISATLWIVESILHWLF